MPEAKTTDLPRFLLDSSQACYLLSVSRDTLDEIRNDAANGWIQGCHWVQLTPGGKYRYNHDLLVDWAANRHDLEAHLAAVENFRASLLSSQKRRRSA